MKADFYERALRRIIWLTACVGVVGTIAVLISKGLRPAAGFLAGSALSLANFQALRSLAGLLDGSRKAMVRGLLVALRYLLIAIAVYVIVEILGITLTVVLLGFLSAFGAVILEILYELILYARA